MAEYIEREAAMDIFGEGPMWTGYFEPYPIEVHHAMVGVARLVKEEVGKIPAADVAPVVHGEWAPSEGNPGFLVCSVCGDCYVYDEWVDGRKWRYCPNCGAKMDGKDEDA